MNIDLKKNQVKYFQGRTHQALEKFLMENDDIQIISMVTVNNRHGLWYAVDKAKLGAMKAKEESAKKGRYQTKPPAEAEADAKPKQKPGPKPKAPWGKKSEVKI